MDTIDALKARISPGDPISFSHRNNQIAGRVVSLGRACATVRCELGKQYRVPYGRLHPRGPAKDHSAVEDRALGRCRELLQLHGLGAAGWVARLDESRSRAGACNFTKKCVLLSRLYVRSATRPELDDTILHEIAHALVGPHHHHDAVWRAKARAIGCSGERCHTLQFSPPRWIVACAAGCFMRSAHRRRRRAVCRRCGGPITWRAWDGRPEREQAISRDRGPATKGVAVPAVAEPAPVVPGSAIPAQGEFDFAMG